MLAGADNKVAPRPVQAGEWLGKDWVILGGLKAGDKVIVDNLMKLRPGAPVAPHPPAVPGAQAPAPAPAKQG
jgi:membrane fusion protein (multidrug efflux system)